MVKLVIFKREQILTSAVKKVLSEQLAALWLSGGLTQDLVDSCAGYDRTGSICQVTLGA